MSLLAERRGEASAVFDDPSALLPVVVEESALSPEAFAKEVLARLLSPAALLAMTPAPRPGAEGGATLAARDLVRWIQGMDLRDQDAPRSRRTRVRQGATLSVGGRGDQRSPCPS